ncbi:MAG: flippase [Ignavibacteriales bacterium]|nr:flippase [Ignavibacteriales bacterium]
MGHTRSGLIARNSVMNFLGQFIPLVVGVISIPFIIQRLGIDQFGILSLAWMLLGYFTLFDLGLGRATTKFVAEAVHNDALQNLRTLFWSSCGTNLFMGIIGAAVVAGLAPVLAERVFRIPPALVDVASTTFLILAVSTPIVLVSTVFRGTLEAAQRFDYVSSVNFISSSFTFLMPVAGILLGFDVRGIILLLMIARLCSATAYLLLCFKVFPVLRESVSFDFNRVKALLTFGGWVSISSFVNPILVYLDRFFIGSMISIAAVAYYTAPYEMVTRLWILPASLTMTLFPAFSAMSASSRDALPGLYSRSVKYLFLLMAPLVMLLVLFAGDILRLWLGTEFAENSALVFQVLAVGILFNSMAQIPFALLQGLGRPDLTAKFHLLELVLTVPLMWFMVSNFGIRGAALAWSTRVLVDALMLFGASGPVVGVHLDLGKEMVRGFAAVLLLASGLIALSLMGIPRIALAISAIGIVGLFAFASWRYVLGPAERHSIASIARGLGFLAEGTR